LKEQSQPIVYEEVKNTYTKGPFYCVYTANEESHKFPVSDIFRVIEDYGFHGREVDE
jgi:hypothetical protein